ncbi:hypothetical protein HanIR_Chr14g0694731 [Helianthus annuus]|nr:hypothetical protein HanIR_Chr14g0694731 [Helianthus annuus]
MDLLVFSLTRIFFVCKKIQIFYKPYIINKQSLFLKVQKYITKQINLAKSCVTRVKKRQK